LKATNALKIGVLWGAGPLQEAGESMVAASISTPARPLHPLHAILLAFPVPMFLGALLSDIAYWVSFQVQWANFSSWLIAGGLLVGVFVVLWAAINLIRGQTGRRARPLIYFVTLLLMWAVAFINALVHAKDAWAAMPAGLYLSVITVLLALVAAWIGYSGFRNDEVR
jgi:uncharacterized membrane protein